MSKKNSQTETQFSIQSSIQPYDSFKLIAPDLYCLDGEWFDTPLRRRMTIMRLKSKGLVIHNAIRLKDEDYAKLDALGQVEVIIAPNAFHGSDSHFYKKHYPLAKLFVSPAAARSISKETQ